MARPKYPNVTVNISDVDGNAFSIMGAVIKEMRQQHISAAEQVAFQKEAMAEDYDHLLQTCMRWVNVT
jgi:hypothetical protein